MRLIVGGLKDERDVRREIHEVRRLPRSQAEPGYELGELDDAEGSDP